MRVRILHDGEAIGEADLPRFTGTGMTAGPFVPYPAYERLRRFFRRFFHVLHTPGIDLTHEGKAEVQRCYAERDALHLLVTDFMGNPIPTHVVTIWDLSADFDGEDVYQAEINVDYESFGKNLFWESE